MFALIKDGDVIQIESKKFSVHSSLEWIHCDETVSVGYSYINKQFVPPAPVTSEETLFSPQEQIEILVKKLEGDSTDYIKLLNQLGVEQSSIE